MKGIPPTFTVEPKSTAVVKGKIAEFNCRIAGSPKPEVNFIIIYLSIKYFHLGSMVS